MALSECPNCGSDFLQPLRCEAAGEDEVLVDLRCPECHVWMQASYTRAAMRALDDRQTMLRESIVNAYEASVAEAMESLAACLGAALELDLIGADDFAPRRVARSA